MPPEIQAPEKPVVTPPAAPVAPPPPASEAPAEPEAVEKSALGIGPLEGDEPESLETPEVPEPPAAPTPPPPPVAATPAVPPPAPPQQSPQFLYMQQELARQQAALQQREAELQTIRNKQELEEYQATLRNLGYTEEQIVAGSRQVRDLQAERQQLAQERLRLQQTAVSAQQEIQYKLAVAQHFNQKYPDVSVSDYLTANTPQDMEIMGLKSQLAKQQKPPIVPTQTYAKNAPTPTPSTGRTALLDRYLETMGRGMTKEQLRVLFPDRY